MLVHLDQKWIEFMRTQRETGMGYQAVRVTLRFGVIGFDAYVLNSETLSVPDDTPPFTLEDIMAIDIIPYHSQLT
jgi:hypothetical protein